MLRLDLTSKEAESLASILESVRSDLSYEIANTDSLDFREKLKARQAVVNRLLDSLSGRCASA